MMGKRERSEDVYGFVPQRLCDRVRAALPKPQCPVVEESHSSGARLDADATTTHELPFLSWDALRGGRCAVSALKGMSGAPTSRSDVPPERNMGGPTRRESHGPGVLVVPKGIAVMA